MIVVTQVSSGVVCGGPVDLVLCYSLHLMAFLCRFGCVGCCSNASSLQCPSPCCFDEEGEDPESSLKASTH